MKNHFLTCERFISGLCIVWILCVTPIAINAQEVSPELNYRIKTAIIKNYMAESLYDKWSYVLKDSSLYYLSPHRNHNGHILQTLFGGLNMRFFGFGYMPGEIEIKVEPLYIEYPKKDWKLYVISFLDIPRHDTLTSFYAHMEIHETSAKYLGGVWPLITQKKIIIAVNANMDIRFVNLNGMGFVHEIFNDFKIKKNRPITFIPFIELKYYNSNYIKMHYSRRENTKLVFLFEHNSGSQSELYLNPENPDKLVRFKSIKPALRDTNILPYYNSTVPQPDPYAHYRIPLGFPTLADKERYLKDVLMRNLYMYRFHQLNNLPERLNYDTISRCLRSGQSDFDRMLPDYDEYLGELELFKRYCCFSAGASAGCYDYYWSPIFEGKEYLDGNTRKLVGGTLVYRNVEFYALIKSRKEVLYKRPGGSFDEVKDKLDPRWKKTTRKGQELWYRYDTYYHPHLANEEAPPAPINADKWYNNCYSHIPFRTAYDDLAEPADFYLLALDTFTREVYFISGDGIYLSAASNLYKLGYHPNKVGINPDDGKPVEWFLKWKLCYIRDRLHQYLIEDLTQDHIVTMDDKKIVVEVTGRPFPFRPKPYRVRATFYEDRPELLDIEVLE